MTPGQVAIWKNKQLWCFDEFYFLLNAEEPHTRAPFHEQYRSLLCDEYQNLRSWFERSSIYPKAETNPCGALLQPAELLEWAATLEGVEIPKIWHSIYQPKIDKADSASNESLGDRNYKNLMATIGILALALAESASLKEGNRGQPNIAKLVAHCQAVITLPPGLAESTLRNRITEGIHTLNEKLNC